MPPVATSGFRTDQIVGLVGLQSDRCWQRGIHPRAVAGTGRIHRARRARQVGVVLLNNLDRVRSKIAGKFPPAQFGNRSLTPSPFWMALHQQ